MIPVKIIFKLLRRRQTALILLVGLCFPATLQAEVLEVGEGQLYTTIQSAIDDAVEDDVVLVYPGVYSEIVDFEGKAIKVESAEGPPATIITNDTGMQSAVYFVSGEGPGSVLNGFTISSISFSGGGVALSNASAPTIKNCIFTKCVSVYGAGMYCYNASPTVINCVFYANSGAYGTCILARNSSAPLFINCTLTQNRAISDGSITDANGAGIYCDGSYAAFLNCILWANTADGQPNQIYTTAGGSVSVSYSAIQDGWPGEGNIAQNPVFVDPGTWSGPTISDVFSGGDFHLQSTSPCIDAGTSDEAPGADSEGLYRYDVPGVPNTGDGYYPYYDMGAYEYNGTPTVVELNSFSTLPLDRTVVVVWSTASEIDNAGFNLYRSARKNGEYVRINSDLIPAEGSATEGASYEFVDEDVRNRKTCWYKLEDVDLNGVSTMHGPVKAVPRLIHGIDIQ